MKGIKELAPKISDALTAMVNGLERQSTRPDFVINMGTYGEVDKQTCFGCAATCAIQELFKIDFTPQDEINFSSERGQVLNTDPRDLSDFEEAIDAARSGELSYLEDYYNITIEEESVKYRHVHLTTSTWVEELPKMKQWIEDLKRYGY